MEKTKRRSIRLSAGAATVNITPMEPCFLFGYPFVGRTSTGVNDWLLSSALYLNDGEEQVLFISNDLIYVSKATVARVRKTISEKTGIPVSHILIGATHTHSGPVTIDFAASANDQVVPKVDVKYLKYLEENIVRAACHAFENASSAEIGLFVADGTGIGTNRHDPTGTADLDIPVLVARKPNGEFIACMMVCNMHPTVLHEDSTLFSGDFPAYAREILQKMYLMYECPVLYFTGAAGNQSPRHVTQDNTVDEARRIGGIIAKSAGTKIRDGIQYRSDIPLAVFRTLVDLPRRLFPDVEQANRNRQKAWDRLTMLKDNSKNRQEIRTAEVDWFGAEELFHFAEMAQTGLLDEYYKGCLPAEIQTIKIGPWSFVAWPGEIFVEYELELKKHDPNIFLITLSNGELQGYIASEEAERSGHYEASNSIFHFSGGKILVDETLKLLKKK